jgi:hypothetical protein
MAQIDQLDPQTAKDINEYGKAGRSHLGIDGSIAPLEVVKRIETYIKGVKIRGESLDENTVIGLGVLLGEQYVRAFSWHWSEVVRNGVEEDSEINVLSPNNAFAINPMRWINKVLSSEREPNFLLGFNMTEAGHTAQGTPNEAMTIN